ncbi:MAG: hypothetical protein U9R27_02185 [Campylobacterota bacterium]|nr:hypothetical protein [Campylobacterota bacterium]
MIETIKIENDYSPEEKKMILKKLSQERLERQRQKELQTMRGSKYDPEKKQKILEELDAKRRKKQKKRYKFKNKKIHTLENRDFYKLLGLGRDYYIKVEDCANYSDHAEVLTIYHRGFDGLKKDYVLVEFRSDSDKIFISEDTLRIYFKPVSIEDN